MIISVPKDCDNAPKRQVIKEFLSWLYENKWSEIEKMIGPNFEFKSIAENKSHGFQSLKKIFTKKAEIKELCLSEILTHGKYGACNGKIILQKETFNIAYFIEFKSAGKNIITKLTEYKI